MSDLDRQLHAYFDVLADEIEANVISRHGESDVDLRGEYRGSIAAQGDTFVEPLETEVCEQCGADLEVFDLREPVESAAPARQKRGAVVVAAVAAALLLVVGIVVADRNDGNVVTDAVSLPSVSVPAAPPAVADPGSSRWPLVFRGPVVLGGVGASGMLGVVAGGPGFVAVGGSGGNAAVWTSVDGLSWSRVPHDEAVFGGEGESTMVDVTVGGPGLVAVGSQVVFTDQEVTGKEDPFTDREDGNAVVWTSVDGLTWSRVVHDESVFGGRDLYRMSSVTAGGPGLVAVGDSHKVVDGIEIWDGIESYGDAVVWTSVDGLTWSRVAHDEAVFGGEGNQEMSDVTVGGPGLVAVGYDGFGAWDNSRGQDAAVWTSVDGLTWSRVPHDEAVFGGAKPAMLSVTAGGPGLVAVGKDAAVWTSVDGLTWSRVIHDQEVGTAGFMVGVTVGGPGLVAVGSRDTEAAVWISPDGLTWSVAAYGESEPGTFHAWMWAVNSTNGRLVGVGNVSPTQGSRAAAAWMRPDS